MLHWTMHARAKMGFYRLSPSRVRSVLHSPYRVEEGVAPKTVAMMQPVSLTRAPGRGGKGKKAEWKQEIWVMIQDTGRDRKVISAWRYPGVTKPRAAAVAGLMRRAYNEYLNDTHESIVQ